MSTRKHYENLGKLCEAYEVPECLRRQTIALRDYLKWAKYKVLPEGKTAGEVAVELYLANEAALKALTGLVGGADQ